MKQMRQSSSLLAPTSSRTELTSGTFLLLLSMGYGLIRAPQLSWNERLISNNIYYSYFQTAECSSKKAQLFPKVEEKYEVV